MRRNVCVLVAMALLLAMAALAVAGCQHEPEPNAAALSNTGMGWMRLEQWSVAVAGADGAATGSGSAYGIEGRLYGVYLDYGVGVTTTVDVTLTWGSPAKTVMVVSDSVTDGWYYPAVQLTGATGSAISGAYQVTPGQGTLTAAVGQAHTGTVTVTALWGP